MKQERAGTHLGCCQRWNVRCGQGRAAASGCVRPGRANQSGVSPFWNPDRECEDGTVRAAWRQCAAPTAPGACTFERGWGSVDVCAARSAEGAYGRCGAAAPSVAAPRRPAACARDHRGASAPLAADPRARQSRPSEAEHEQPIGGTRWTTACAAADGHEITRAVAARRLLNCAIAPARFLLRRARGGRSDSL